MKAKVGGKIAGYYKIMIEKPDGRVVDFFESIGHKGGWMKNIILDSGITKLLNANTSVPVYRAFQLGTDSTAASAAQTTLISRSYGSSTGTPSYGYDTGDEYRWTKVTHTLPKGTPLGNFYEIGVSGDTSDVNLFSRARIEDGGGSPVALTIGADDVVTLTYEFRYYDVVPSSHSVSYDDDGSSESTTVSYVLPSSSDMASSGAPTRGAFAPPVGSLSWGAAATGNTREAAIKFSEAQGNPSVSTTGVTAGDAGHGWLLPRGFAINFSPAIPKTSEFTLDIELEFEITRL